MPLKFLKRWQRLKLEKFKNMKKKKIILILLFVLIIIGSIIYFSSHRLNEKDKMVETLYEYIGSNDLDVCKGLNNYDSKASNSKDLSISSKACIAYVQTSNKEKETITLEKNGKNNFCKISDEIAFAPDNYDNENCTVTKLKKKTLNQTIKKIYGDSDLKLTEFAVDNTQICYINGDDIYCGWNQNYTYELKAEPHTYRAIQKVIKKKEKIIIYDYFLKITENKCYKYFTQDIENEKCTAAYTKIKKNKLNYSFLKRYGTKYKHTFKKQNNNYVYIKSEPVK